VSALETGMQCSDRYGGARPFRHCQLEENPVGNVEPVQLVMQGRRPHGKFGAGPLKTVAKHKKQRNRQTVLLLYR